MKEFLKRKNIEISLKRYGIDALGAMAQGLFCSLLIGTILNTFAQQLHIDFLNQTVATIGTRVFTIASLPQAMSGAAMALAIGYALKCLKVSVYSYFGNKPIRSTRTPPAIPETPAAPNCAAIIAVPNKPRLLPSRVDKLTNALCDV